jgi:small subunit ribosomal protein S16
VSVRIRMKQFGRRHRPYYRICAMDIRRPRDGRVLEELGTYDPMIPETDARAVLNSERIAYWVSVGAQPSDKVSVLIKKYGANGTHVAAQQAAIERLAQKRRRPELLPQQPKAPKPQKAERAPKAEKTPKVVEVATVTEVSVTAEAQASVEPSADATTKEA